MRNVHLLDLTVKKHRGLSARSIPVCRGGSRLMEKKTIRFLSILVILFLLFTGCNGQPTQNTGGSEMIQEKTYKQISQDEAKEMMTWDDGHVIVDVRRQDEYDAGHIPGAILIPNESIGTTQPEQLPDLEQVILIYCRSGNRSKQAAQKLADMGYVNVYEFGGIITWTGDIVTDRGPESSTG